MAYITPTILRYLSLTRTYSLALGRELTREEQTIIWGQTVRIDSITDVPRYEFIPSHLLVDQIHPFPLPLPSAPLYEGP